MIPFVALTASASSTRLEGDWLLDQLNRLPEYLTGIGAAELALVAASTVGSAATGRLLQWLVWRWRHSRLTQDARLLEVSVPPRIEPQNAAALWSQLMGLLHPRWKRLLYGQSHLGFEYIGNACGVRIQLWVPGLVAPGAVEKAVRAAWPGATVTQRPATPPIPLSAAVEGGRLGLGRSDHFPLKCDHDTDPLRALLEALTGLEPSDYAAVQILARPITGRRLRRAHRMAAALRGGRSITGRGRLFDALTPGHGPGSVTTARVPAGELARSHPERAEQVRAILIKAAQPRYEVAVRYGVATTTRPATSTRSRLRARVHTLAGVFALYTAGNQYLRRRRLHRPAAMLASRRLEYGYLLSVPELAALAHLPYDSAAPGITRAGAHPTPPPPAIDTSTSTNPAVRVLGETDAGPARPVGLSVADTRHHVHVLGATGSGKSTLLAHLVLADATAGRGALVIDPKGDLITDLLDRLPKKAVERTVVFDPADTAPPSINVLAGPDPAFTVDQVVTIFHRCFASAWGPRIDDLLRSACLTLTRVHGQRASLSQLPTLLTDTRFRARTLASLNDELLQGFWSSYDALTPAGRSALTAPVMNKLRAFLLRRFIDQTIARPYSTVDLGRHLDQGGLILAAAPKGVLGDDAARLFGSLLLAHAWQSITRRARTHQHDRPDAAVYVDECHNFLNLPGSVSDVLAEARGYRLSLVLAHQHLAQLPKDLREALSADARNKIYFAASPEDAHDLRHHVTPVLTEHDLAHLGAYQVAARLIANGAQARAFTLRTRPLSAAIPGRRQAVRDASHRQYAAKQENHSGATRPALGGRRRSADPRTSPTVTRVDPRRSSA